MDSKYFDRLHVWGTVWNYAALVMMFTLPVGVSLVFDAWPAAGVIGKILLTLIPLYWITAIVEVVTYVPILGAGGTYLSFVTGNIANLRLPCGLNAMENAGVRANSEEGEVISTLSIGASAIATTVVIAAGAICMAGIYFLSISDGLHGIYVSDILILACALFFAIYILFTNLNRSIFLFINHSNGISISCVCSF